MTKLYLSFSNSGTLSHKLTWSHYYDSKKSLNQHVVRIRDAVRRELMAWFYLGLIRNAVRTKLSAQMQGDQP